MAQECCWNPVPASTCASFNGTRRECDGPRGMNKSRCASAGCCWDEGGGQASCGNIPIAEREPCGAPATAGECAALGCCWDSDVPCWAYVHCCYKPRTPACFSPPAPVCHPGPSRLGYWFTAPVEHNETVYAVSTPLVCSDNGPGTFPPSAPRALIVALDGTSGKVRREWVLPLCGNEGAGFANYPCPLFGGWAYPAEDMRMQPPSLTITGTHMIVAWLQFVYGVGIVENTWQIQSFELL